MAGAEEVGPDLRLDHDKSRGPDGVKGPRNCEWEVDGAVNKGVWRREAALRLLPSSRAGDAHDETERRVVAAQRLDELEGHAHLADAGGVDENCAAITEGVALGLREAAEPVAEVLAVAAAPPHLQDKVRRHNEARDDEEKII